MFKMWGTTNINADDNHQSPPSPLPSILLLFNEEYRMEIQFIGAVHVSSFLRASFATLVQIAIGSYKA